MSIENHFHNNGFALSLALKQRLETTGCEKGRPGAYTVAVIFYCFEILYNMGELSSS